MPTPKSSKIADLAKLLAVCIAAVSLFFGGNLMSRCEGLQTEAQAKEDIRSLESKIDKLADSLETTRKLVHENAVQIRGLDERTRK